MVWLTWLHPQTEQCWTHVVMLRAGQEELCEVCVCLYSLERRRLVSLKLWNDIICCVFLIVLHRKSEKRTGKVNCWSDPQISSNNCEGEIVHVNIVIQQLSSALGLNIWRFYCVVDLDQIKLYSWVDLHMLYKPCYVTEAGFWMLVWIRFSRSRSPFVSPSVPLSILGGRIPKVTSNETFFFLLLKSDFMYFRCTPFDIWNINSGYTVKL